MSKPHFKKSEALPKIVAAYENGELQAQKAPTGRPCCYRGDGGTPCAIGLLIDDDTAKKWDERDDLGIPNSASVNALFRKGAASADDIDWFVAVQDTHDNWLQTGGNVQCIGSDKTYEQRFRELIGL
ncbi:MAG: hypothetical protein NXH70_02185 [Hyphomonas sp.]|nr:hypothetical protein [Hyphomonas sp.]